VVLTKAFRDWFEVVGVMPAELDIRGVARFPNARYWLT
jgi:hypothetical protein